MPIAKGKVQAITLRHQIASQIRKAILDGSLHPGERVVERALALQLGASVTAVREAVIQLESEGLITKKSNTATNITELTEREIRQTFAVRSTLERMAVAEAADHATPAAIRRLRELHDLATAAANRRDRRVYVQRDFAWHEAVWAASENEVLEHTLRRVARPLFGFSIIQVVSEPSFDLAEDARSHTPILEAIARQDREQAVAAFERAIYLWTTHVRESRPGQQEDKCLAFG